MSRVQPRHMLVAFVLGVVRKGMNDWWYVLCCRVIHGSYGTSRFYCSAVHRHSKFVFDWMEGLGFVL